MYKCYVMNTQVEQQTVVLPIITQVTAVVQFIYCHEVVQSALDFAPRSLGCTALT